MKILYFFFATLVAVPVKAQLFGGQIKSSRVISQQPSFPPGSVFCNGPTMVVDVTNPVTGKTWMDRNLGASQVATSSTDSLAYGDLYQWGRRSDGHQCRNSPTISILSSTDQPVNGSFILAPNTPFDWRSPQNNNLWQGVNGINNPCPSGYRLPTETELNNERLSWSSNNSTGAFTASLKWTLSGYRTINGLQNVVGTEGDYWSSTFNGQNSRVLAFSSITSLITDDNRANGEAVRCIKDASAIQGTIISINCGSATNTGTLTQGTAASGVSSSVPYTGGNGGTHNGQTVASTGVTGLTATLTAGTFANGAGSLTYNISGTPATSGTASFALNIGGQTCVLSLTVAANLAAQYPAGSVFCASGPTAIVEVTNPVTGRTWMDRNLGASQVATSSTDALGKGDLYQWGRRSDGHQCRNSSTTTNLSSSDQPLNGNFIISPNSPNDWRSPQNNNLWQGVNGVNNPCPLGYRLPTEIELNNERLTWISDDNAGAFASPLKFPRANSRVSTDGVIGNTFASIYWASNISSIYSRSLRITISTIGPTLWGNLARANGCSVRCIKN